MKDIGIKLADDCNNTIIWTAENDEQYCAHVEDHVNIKMGGEFDDVNNGEIVDIFNDCACFAVNNGHGCVEIIFLDSIVDMELV